MHLALDIGNVVGHINFTKFLDLLSRTKNITTTEAYCFLNDIQKQHDLGFFTLKDKLSDHFKIKSEGVLNDLIEEWNNVLDLNKDMISFIHDQLKTGTKIALVSNIGQEHAALIEEKFHMKLIKFFSCDVGARKPTYLYYQSFLNMYPEFKNCVYIDDRDENLLTGTKFGFNSLKFELDKGDTVDKINKFIEGK